MSWPSIETILATLGIGSVWTFGVLVVVAAFRALLRHTIGLWGARADVGGSFEYRFAVQNLESVPVDEPVEIILEEPALKQELDAHRRDHDPGDLKVYSGAELPTFSYVRDEFSNDKVGSWFQSRVTFRTMPAHDTWTLKLRSPARSVRLRIRPLGAPVQPLPVLQPWIAVTLSTGTLLVDSDKPVNSIPPFVPAIQTVAALCAVGPLLYLSVILPLLAVFGGSFSWFTDPVVALALGASGLLWYFWVRRPVYPTIQGYTTGRSPPGAGIAAAQSAAATGVPTAPPPNAEGAKADDAPPRSQEPPERTASDSAPPEPRR